MEKIGLFYGQMGGYTREVAELIKREIEKEYGQNSIVIKNIASSTPEELAAFEILILGAPTYQHGKLDDEWDNFLPKFKSMNFTDRKVALFALGNAIDFPDSFAGSIGILASIIKKRGALLIGSWPTEGYEPFTFSPAKQNDKFVGLVIDEMSQPDKTRERVRAWVEQIKKECSSEN